jgi:tetratricopeptide (TPR) repeat protein
MPWIWNSSIFGFNWNGTKALLAQAYKEKGDLDKAIAIYEQLTDPNPENREGRLIYPKNYYHLALCYETQIRIKNLWIDKSANMFCLLDYFMTFPKSHWKFRFGGRPRIF